MLGILMVAMSLGAPPQAPSSAYSFPFLMVFHAEWCPACKEMESDVKALDEAGYDVRTIDATERQDLIQHFQVRGLPTLIVASYGTREGYAVTYRTEGKETREGLLLIVKAWGVARRAGK